MTLAPHSPYRQSAPPLPDGIERILKSYPGERLLVLEGENMNVGVGLVVMLSALGLPGLFAAGFKEGWRSGLLALAVYTVVLGVLWLALPGGPSDLVLTPDGVHLFWRWSTWTKHRLLRGDSISSVGATCHTIELRIREGGTVKIPLTYAGKSGVYGTFKVTWNITDTVFDGQRASPNHVEAFKSVVESLFAG